MICISFFLFALSKVFSQDVAAAIQKNLQDYNAFTYQEKVFLHTDKTVYAIGEILWFKAYITNANTNQLSNLSKVCYVEIISAEKRPVLQAKIEIDSGTGNGSVTIPSSVRTGNYILRAYTNWMKNFDPDLYFEQAVSIINAGKKPEFLKQKDSAALYVAQFFPEGGNLVYGLNSTVAFKLTDSYGRGVTGEGILINDKNDTIVKFSTGLFGMGTFSLTPALGNKYHALTRINGFTYNYDLPEIYTNGWALHLEGQGKMLRIKVNCNVDGQQQVFLFIHARDSMKYAKMEFLKNDSAEFIINKSSLGNGISSITLFNEKKQPVCERLYFKKPTQLLHVQLSDPQTVFQQRKKVDINMRITDDKGQPINTDMSVSAYLVDSLQPPQDVNILNYMWLGSEIKGPIEAPMYYLESEGPDVDKTADNLMLTQGWRRFDWEQVLANSKPSFTFLPEHEGHIITGKLSSSNRNVPDTGVHVYLTVPGGDFRFANTTSLKEGIVRFNVEKFYGRHEIIIEPGFSDGHYDISVDNPFSEKFSDTRFCPLVLRPNLAGEILLRTIGVQSVNIYQPKKNEQYLLPDSYDTTAFFGYPSKTYYLDDYTRFPALEEVMREYIREVHVRNRQKEFHYEVYNEVNKLYFDDDPLVIIDGLRVLDVNKLMKIDPLKIKKIDITTMKFFRGGEEYNGIVSYTTYNNDLGGYEADPGSFVVDYEGLQFQREFYSPQYENSQELTALLPDYRNVLYWAPHIKTENGKYDFSFYTSDIPGTYNVIVQGISPSGLMGAGSTYIIVK